jgi:hypothetical protein
MTFFLTNSLSKSRAITQGAGEIDAAGFASTVFIIIA